MQFRNALQSMLAALTVLSFTCEFGAQQIQAQDESEIQNTKLPIRSWRLGSSSDKEIKGRFEYYRNEMAFVRKTEGHSKGKLSGLKYHRLGPEDKKFVDEARINPFLIDPLAEKETIPDKVKNAPGLVIVSVNGRLEHGYVIKKNRERAYVAMLSQYLEWACRHEPSTRSINFELHCLAQSKGTWKKIPAELKGKYLLSRSLSFQTPNFWVLSCPAEHMPEPITSDNNLSPKKESELWTIGFQSVARFPQMFHRDFVKLSVRQPFTTVKKTNRLIADLKISNRNNRNHLRGQLVVNEEGVAIGVIIPREQTTSLTGHTALVSALPWSKRIESASLDKFRVGIVSGNKRTLRFQFVTKISDPLETLVSRKLLVRQLSEKDLVKITEERRRKYKDSAPPTFVDSPIKSAKKVDLKNTAPNQLVLYQVAPKGILLEHDKPLEFVAEVDVKNPGPVKFHRFQVQVIGVDKDNETRHFAPMLVSYSSIFGRHYIRNVGFPEWVEKVREIPGLDGKPIGSRIPTP